MARISKPDWFMLMTQVISMRATCSRRQVGCVLVDNHDNVISTGYNGVARGMLHCTEYPCPGADCLSGQGLDLCEAIHAEQNALLQCSDVNKIKDCYTSTFPCVHCIKLLMNTSCLNIYYHEPYPGMEQGNKLWLKSSSNRLIFSTWKKYYIEETK